METNNVLLEFEFTRLRDTTSWESRILLDELFGEILPAESNILLLGHRTNSYYLKKEDLERLRGEISSRINDDEIDCHYYDYIDEIRQSMTYLLKYSLTEVLIFINYFEMVVLLCSNCQSKLSEIKEQRDLFNYDNLQSITKDDDVIFSFIKKKENEVFLYTKSRELAKLISDTVGG